MTQMSALPGALIPLPSYLWRAPRWTHAHDYPVLYDDYGMLLVECALLDELEPALQAWNAARRRRPSVRAPAEEDRLYPEVGPKELLKELESVRAEVRSVLRARCRPLQARRDEGRVYEELSQRTTDFWADHLGANAALVKSVILAQMDGAERIDRFRAALGDDASPDALEKLTDLERLVARHAEKMEACRQTERELELDLYARGDLYDRVHSLVRHIHAKRPHPVERSVPRAPPCDPDRSPNDAFVLPVEALRLMQRLVRDLAELDAFLATGRLPRDEDYLPPPEERFATVVRARAVLCATLERGAEICARYDDAVAHSMALDELSLLCLELASSCQLPPRLVEAGTAPDAARVFELATDLLAALHASDHPRAPEARARLGVVMALTPRGAPPKAELDYGAMHLDEEGRALLREAQFAIYRELPDDLLY